VIKTLVFGDLAHVRSFGANLTTYCLAEDLSATRQKDEELIYEAMPHIGASYSNGWKLVSNLNPAIAKNLRNIRMRYKPLDLGKIKYSNVHYKSPLTATLPNTLSEFANFESYVERSDLLKSLLKKVSMADRVIINGEGNIVNHIGSVDIPYRVGARLLLIVAYMCRELRKPFSLVNCTIDPANENIDLVLSEILAYAHHVSVREPISYEYATNILGLNNVLESADASLGYDFGCDKYSKGKVEEPFVILGDSSGLRGDAREIYSCLDYLIKHFSSMGMKVKILDCSTPYSHVLGKLALKHSCVWLSDHYLNFKSLQREFRGAELIVSGRWHPSILASNVGVTPVTYGSDSCKTLGYSKKMNSLHIKGGVHDLCGNLDLVDEAMITTSRVKTLERSLSWSALRTNNLIRPE